MEIEYDVAKSRSNAERRGIQFTEAIELLSGPHLRRRDDRREYGERRLSAYFLIRGRMHVFVCTLRGDIYRIISLRKANRREVDAYGPFVFR